MGQKVFLQTEDSVEETNDYDDESEYDSESDDEESFARVKSAVTSGGDGIVRNPSESTNVRTSTAMYEKNQENKKRKKKRKTSRKKSPRRRNIK